MFLLSPHDTRIAFPHPDDASPDGLLAIGGDLSEDRLLEAYRRGIFPWYSTGQPILWWSPDPRAVLYLDDLKISRSLRKRLRRAEYTVSFDRRFRAVMGQCAAPRDQDRKAGTWITPDMIDAYCRLHDLGYAHSVETWYRSELVGGLYGVALGRGFFGESMFSRRADASKVALAALVERLRQWNFAFIDCQLPSPHILTLGAQAIPRMRFLRELSQALRYPDRIGDWGDGDPSRAVG